MDATGGDVMPDLFKILKDDLAAHFQKMTEDNLYLYVVDLEGDPLWEFYLNSIPQKMNPVFRVRRKYDCSACRNFIRQIGNAVAIRNGELQSIWDFELRTRPGNLLSGPWETMYGLFQ